MDRSELEALLELVGNATGPDREIDSDIFHAFDGEQTVGRYTASVDAALALVERCLPGWSWSIMRPEPDAPSRGAWATLSKKGNGEGYACPEYEFEADLATPPLAILAALLRALVAQPAEKIRSDMPV